MYYSIPNQTGTRQWGTVVSHHPDPDFVEQLAVANGKEFRRLRDHLVEDLGIDAEVVRATHNADLEALVETTEFEQSGLIRLTVTACTGDHGSIVLFDGVDDKDQTYTFGVDRRYAADIYNALIEGEDVNVEIEGWQVFGGPYPLQVHGG